MMKELILPSQTSSIGEVQTFIELAVDRNPQFTNLFGNILMAVNEAFNNAVKHGNRFDPNRSVRLRLREEDSLMEFTISDEGQGFAYGIIVDPTLPENIEKTSGRGIYIMHQLADSVQYQRNGATVVLTFLACK